MDGGTGFTPLSRDQPCVVCGHGPHHVIDCECGCSLPFRPGIDTALGGG